MVMEMTSCNLSSFVDEHQNISIHIKYSIVHDISLGLRYLHGHEPPIVHRNLFPNNISLTGCFVAKISDIALADGELNEHLLSSSSDATGFLSPELLSGGPISMPMDTFSFAGISLYILNQRRPRVSTKKKFDSNAVILSEVEKRQEHLDIIRTEFVTLKPLLVECLNNDPAARPTMKTVSEMIQRDKNKYTKRKPRETTLKAHVVARLQKNIIKQVSM